MVKLKLKKSKSVERGEEEVKLKFRDKFWDFIYSKFGFLGKMVLAIFPNIPSLVRNANIRIYYEAYASFVGFLFIISTIISLSLIHI